jgi:hypothetical protein
LVAYALAMAFVVPVVLGGCKSNVDVTVRARPEGSGLIRVKAVLDREAAGWLGPPEKALATTDLEAAGWTIRSVSTVEGGGVTFGAERSFASISEGNNAISQLGEAFSGLRLDRQRSLVSTAVRMSGKVDLSARLESFGDVQLQQVVGSASKIGVPEAELVGSGPTLEDAVVVTLHSELGNKVQDFPLTWGKITTVAAAGRSWSWDAALGVGGALIGLIALVIVRRAKE